METYEILKELRKNKGLTQKKLAESVGITQQALALLENGKRKIEIDLFINLVIAMGCSENELSTAINNFFDNKYKNKIIIKIPKSETEKAKAKEERLQEEKEMSFLNKMSEFHEVLNDLGREEAVKRVQELTEIKRYTDPDPTE